MLNFPGLTNSFVHIDVAIGSLILLIWCFLRLYVTLKAFAEEFIYDPKNKTKFFSFSHISMNVEKKKSSLVGILFKFPKVVLVLTIALMLSLITRTISGFVLGAAKAELEASGLVSSFSSRSILISETSDTLFALPSILGTISVGVETTFYILIMSWVSACLAFTISKSDNSSVTEQERKSGRYTSIHSVLFGLALVVWVVFLGIDVISGSAAFPTENRNNSKFWSKQLYLNLLQSVLLLGLSIVGFVFSNNLVGAEKKKEVQHASSFESFNEYAGRGGTLLRSKKSDKSYVISSPRKVTSQSLMYASLALIMSLVGSLYLTLDSFTRWSSNVPISSLVVSSIFSKLYIVGHFLSIVFMFEVVANSFFWLGTESFTTQAVKKEVKEELPGKISIEKMRHSPVHPPRITSATPVQLPPSKVFTEKKPSPLKQSMFLPPIVENNDRDTIVISPALRSAPTLAQLPPSIKRSEKTFSDIEPLTLISESLRGSIYDTADEPSFIDSDKGFKQETIPRFRQESIVETETNEIDFPSAPLPPPLSLQRSPVAPPRRRKDNGSPQSINLSPLSQPPNIALASPRKTSNASVDEMRKSMPGVRNNSFDTTSSSTSFNRTVYEQSSTARDGEIAIFEEDEQEYF
ncbi:hypothetical protein MP638_001485 [Amoeboaphelidium occidentale]|nr:hypothetical protein MP638_001485 [Amoeboaphelidium occidentale]